MENMITNEEILESEKIEETNEVSEKSCKGIAIILGIIGTAAVGTGLYVGGKYAVREYKLKRDIRKLQKEIDDNWKKEQEELKKKESEPKLNRDQRRAMNKKKKK